MEEALFFSVFISIGSLVAFFIMLSHVAKIKSAVGAKTRQQHLADFYKWKCLSENKKAKASLDEFIWLLFKDYHYANTNDKLQSKYDKVKTEYEALYQELGYEFPSVPNWDRCFKIN